MNFKSLHLDKICPSGKKVSATRMDSKNLKFTRNALCALLATIPLCELQAQPPADPPADPPAAPQAANELEQLFVDAEKAFTEKNYPVAVGKLEELLKQIDGKQGVPPATLEMIRFNIGLGLLLVGDAPSAVKAEAAFTECLAKYPNGDYASRCALGIGRACLIQNTPEKKEKAVNALKQAAADPKYRSEAGLALGQVYNDLQRPEEAFKVFKTLMGSDIRTPQQTGAAVEVIGLLAQSEQLDDLTAYLDRVINSAGVRDAIAWYTNQIVVRASDLATSGSHEIALALFRSIPPRRQILETQRASLEEQKKEIAELEKKIADEVRLKVPLPRRSTAGEQIGVLKAALELNTKAIEEIDKAEDLDADLLLSRGRSLYFLERYQEALVCFQAIRNVYPTAKNLETASYSEIVTYNQLGNTDELQKRAADFLTKHPNSSNLEQIAVIAGQGLEKAGKWDEMLKFYEDLASKFPNSQSLDRYVFFQGRALFLSGKFAESGELFKKFVQQFSSSSLYEDALYQVAITNFIQGKYKETLASCDDYLKKFPVGRYAGDVRYRLAYIDFRDDEKDQSQKLIKDINAFASANPDDPSTGMMLNLLGDTYSQKKEAKEIKDAPEKALDAYLKAANSESSEEVVRYALEQATVLLQGKKDWAGLTQLHQGIMKRYPGTALSLISTTWVVKMMVRENRGVEAAELLAETLKESIADPTNEQVEPLIDEMVRTMVPKRVRGVEINADELAGKLNEMFDKAAAGQENPTTNARKSYAGARLFDMLRLPERSDLLLKGIAANTNPDALSPMLLSACGEILLKDGQLELAEGMFQRIVDRYQDSAFADSGPVGLGQVAMAKKDFTLALERFTYAIEEAPGSSRFRDAYIGQLEAMIRLNKLPEAEKLGLELLGNRDFKGEPGGLVYLLLGDLFVARSTTGEKEENLRKANGYYQNAYARFKAYPEIAAKGLVRSAATLDQLGETAAAEEVRKILEENPKFEKFRNVK
jgi:tetratricopeptide (TPR) repeat protein